MHKTKVLGYRSRSSPRSTKVSFFVLLANDRSNFQRAGTLAVFDFSVNISLSIAFFNCLAFVEFLFSACDGDIGFDVAAFTVQRKWDSCQAFGSFCIEEFDEFFFGKEEFAWVARVVAGRGVAGLIGRDVSADQKRFAALDDDM